MRKLSESMWADVHKKNIGISYRKEDVEGGDFFGKDVTYKFYSEGDTRLFSFDDLPDILAKNPGWRIPTVEELNSLAFEVKYNRDFKSDLGHFRTVGGDENEMTVESVKGKMVVRRLGFVSTILGDVSEFHDVRIWVDGHPHLKQHPYLRFALVGDLGMGKHKRFRLFCQDCRNKLQVLLVKGVINESMWADAHKKNIGIETRKEDEQSPFFGEGIEYRLYKEGDKVHFTYDEALKIEEKEKGWRLPMFNEIEAISTDDGDFISDEIDTIQSTYGSLTLPNMGWINAGGTLMGTTSWLIMVKSSHDGFYTISKNGLVHHRDDSYRLKKYSIVLLHDKTK